MAICTHPILTGSTLPIERVLHSGLRLIKLSQYSISNFKPVLAKLARKQTFSAPTFHEWRMEQKIS